MSGCSEGKVHGISLYFHCFKEEFAIYTFVAKEKIFVKPPLEFANLLAVAWLPAFLSSTFPRPCFKLVFRQAFAIAVHKVNDCRTR